MNQDICSSGLAGVLSFPRNIDKNIYVLNQFLGDLTLHIHLDSRLSPLAVNDSQLQNLPLTYILTCQYDILRDDGLMTASKCWR